MVGEGGFELLTSVVNKMDDRPNPRSHGIVHVFPRKPNTDEGLSVRHAADSRKRSYGVGKRESMKGRDLQRGWKPSGWGKKRPMLQLGGLKDKLSFRI